MSNRCFLPSFRSIGFAVSEKIKMWKVNGRRMPSDGKSSHCLWQGELKKSKLFKISPFWVPFRVMVLNTTFNNISVILWQSVLLVEKTGSTQKKSLTCCKLLTNYITLCCIEYISPWAGLKPTTLVVIGTDCTGTIQSRRQWPLSFFPKSIWTFIQMQGPLCSKFRMIRQLEVRTESILSTDGRQRHIIWPQFFTVVV